MAHAQGRGAMSAMARPTVAAPMAAPHVVMHSSQPVGTHFVSGSHPVAGVRFVRTRSGAIVARPPQHGTSPVRMNGRIGGAIPPLLSQDVVPGLGFDYPHFAATHPQGVHDHDRGFVGGFVPFFSGGGYYMPLFPDDVEETPAADAQQADARAPDYSEPAQLPTRSRERVAQNYAPPAQPAPERESEQYVFVRRDGTLFFAAAYSLGRTARFATSLARACAARLLCDKLDLNATQQFNEQRGLNFRLPA